MLSHEPFCTLILVKGNLHVEGEEDPSVSMTSCDPIWCLLSWDPHPVLNNGRLFPT